MKLTCAKEKKIRELLIALRNRDDLNYQIYLKVRRVIVKHVGKKITKKVANAVEEALPGYTIYYDKSELGAYISIWGKDIDYSKRLRFSLGGQDNVDIMRFESNCRCYCDAARERIVEYNKLLTTNNRIARIIEAYDAFKVARNYFECKIGDCESIRHLIQDVL